MQGPLEFHVHPALEDPVLVLAFGGWNDAGEAASTALRFLGRTLNSVPLAEIDPDPFYDFTVARPRVHFDSGHTRELSWPTTQFRYGTHQHVDLVTGLGSEPHFHWRNFSDCIASLAEGIGAHRVVLFGAYLADVVYSRPVTISGFASDPGLLEKLDIEASSYEGPTGIVAVLAERLRQEGHEVVSMWASLPHYLNASPNPRAALALVQRLAAYLGLRIDDSELREESKGFEKRISELVAADPELADYVRQLKKRDFAN